MTRQLAPRLTHKLRFIDIVLAIWSVLYLSFFGVMLAIWSVLFLSFCLWSVLVIAVGK